MNEAEIFIKPAKDGLIVRDPITTRPLDAEGESKPRNKHWLRRLKDKDVVEAKRPVVKSTAKPADSATEKVTDTPGDK